MIRNIFVKVCILFLFVLVVAFFVETGVQAEGHPSFLIGRPFGDGCRWVGYNNVLYIWPDDGVSGILPTVTSDWYGTPWFSSRSSFKKVVVEPGVICGEDMSYMFAGLSSCVEMDLSGLDTSRVRIMKYMFKDCSRMEYFDLSFFSDAHVTNMFGLFYNCSSMVDVDFSVMDTSAVTDISHMFYYCSSLVDFTFDFDTSSLDKMSGLFDYCKGLRRLDISSLDTRNVTDMSSVLTSVPYLSTIVIGPDFSFKGVYPADHYWFLFPPGVWENVEAGVAYRNDLLCRYYDSATMSGVWSLAKHGESGTVSWELDESTGVLRIYPTNGVSGIMDNYFKPEYVPWYGVRKFATSIVVEPDVYANVYCDSMFSSFEFVETIDLSGLHTEGVTNMAGMFNFCPSIQTLDVSMLDTSSVTNMQSMFNGCSSLESVYFSDLFDVSSVVTFSSMFSGCSSLVDLDLSFFDVSSVTTMQNMFYNCSSLEQLDVSNWHCDSLSVLSCAFQNCSGLSTLGIDSWAHLCSVDSIQSMFSGCSSLVEVDVSSFATSPISRPDSCFYGCRSLERIIGLDSLNMSNVTTCENMFNGCSSLSGNYDLRSWDLSSCRSVSRMFYGCSSLDSLLMGGCLNGDVPYLGVEYVFTGCSSLETLDVSGWDVHLARYLYDVFSGCSSLSYLDLSSWSTEQASMNNFFNGCSSLSVVELGEHFSFKGSSTSSSTWAVLPGYTSYWKRDGDFHRYYVYDLRDVYDGSTMAGTYRIDRRYALVYLNGDLVFSSSSLPDESHGECLAVYTDFERMYSAQRVGWRDYSSEIKKVYMETDLLPLSIYYWFGGMYNLTNIYGFENLDTSLATDMSYLFCDDRSLTELDLSHFDTSKVSNMSVMFNGCSNLSHVELGENFSFYGDGSISSNYASILSSPKSGVSNGKWIRNDGEYGAYTPEELRDNYDGSIMAGTWVWDDGMYHIRINPPAEDFDKYIVYTEMLSGKNDEVFGIPNNVIKRFGYKLIGWSEISGGDVVYSYDDNSIVYIPGDTYNSHKIINLYAVFEKLDLSVSVVDGSFEFDLVGGVSASFDGLPGNTQYQIYEDLPSGWQLVEEGNTSGRVPVNETGVSVFKNHYDSTSTQFRIVGQKWMENSLGERYLPGDGAYTFELCDSDGSVLQHKVNDNMGFIIFDPIVVSSVGEYHYTVRELFGDDHNIIYDNHVDDIVVLVTDDGKGHLDVQLKRSALVIAPMVKYSHTSNINDSGLRMSNYGNYWGNLSIVGSDRVSGDSSAHVVTIPGAKSLTVDVYYNGESTSYDWMCVWEGSHPLYTAYGNYATSLSGRLGGSQSGSYLVNENNLVLMGHQTYTVNGDTVTFSFRSDGSGCGQGYGYYAVVTGVSEQVVYNDFDELTFVNKVNTLGSLKLIKNAVDEQGNDHWEDGETFVFDVSFTDKYGSIPSGVCADFLSAEAVENDWTYDYSTGVLTVVLDEDHKSVIINDIPYGLNYDVREVVDDFSVYELTSFSGTTGIISDVLSEAVFVNTFKVVPTSVNFMAYKEADFEINAGDFVFELLDSDMNVIQRVTNGSVIVDGMNVGKAPVVFDGIPVVSDGTFVYYIREVMGDRADVDYDTGLIKIVVDVINEHGYLSADVGYSVL